MNLLFIGDIVGSRGRDAVCELLYDIKAKYSVDFCIANGENAAAGLGINRMCYENLSAAGVDFFTLGNHTFSKPEVCELLAEGENLVRPANYPPGAPGDGVATLTLPSGKKLSVMNLMGRTFLDSNLDNPFTAVDTILGSLKSDYILVDFHAEATSEKRAMGYFLDGRVSAVVGTHTHVQTSDAQVLPKGTAYITDVGMTGPHHSILGMVSSVATERFVTALPRRYEQEKEGPYRFSAILIELSDESMLAKKITPICLVEGN